MTTPKPVVTYESNTVISSLFLELNHGQLSPMLSKKVLYTYILQRIFLPSVHFVRKSTNGSVLCHVPDFSLDNIDMRKHVLVTEYRY